MQQDNMAPEAARNFIRDIVEADRAAGRHGGRVVTRFPPEPNGYLHIGHTKSICLNFGLATDCEGVCHLRFDDTNPTTEEVEFVESIQHDVRWLGYDWGGRLFHASDYFERMYHDAVGLIKKGRAYVCSLNEEQMRQTRGTVTEAGQESPYRQRSIDENLDLFKRMRQGEFPDGSHTLRAKIDMANPNMKMRDPPLYRIRHAHHYRTGTAWPIYPMYDYAHCLSDAYEGVTHSICTLEFENNRELYDWIIAATEVFHQPKQYEFARLNLTYTVLSKRRLATLVREGYVQGWDDPRMPTLAGLRRRGVPPAAIRDFCQRIGVAKANSTVDVGQLEYSIRDHLNRTTPRRLAVLRPLRVIIDNYPEGQSETIQAPSLPQGAGTQEYRDLPLGREIFIEQDDFSEHPPKGFHRLAPGREVRLRYAYVLRCEQVVKDAQGRITALHCTYDPNTHGGKPAEGRKVKGIIHWVAAHHALDAEVRLYDRLFSHEKPDQTEHDFRQHLNPHSLEVVQAKVEASLGSAQPGEQFQFERHGYFCADTQDCASGHLVFNRSVSLKDTWAKQQQSPAKPASPHAKGPPVAQQQAPPQPSHPSQPASAPRPKAPLDAAAVDYFQSLGIRAEHAEILAHTPDMRAFVAAAVKHAPQAQPVANWLVNELLRDLKDRPLSSLPFNGEALGELVALVEDGTISSRTGKDVLAMMVQEGGQPRQIVEQQGWQQLDDQEALEAAIEGVLQAHDDAVEKFKSGKGNTFGFLVGKVMQATRGKANPKTVNSLLQKKLRS